MKRIVLDHLASAIEAALLRAGALVVVRGVGQTAPGENQERIEIVPPVGSSCEVVLVDEEGADVVRLLSLPSGESFEYNLGNDELPAWMWRAPEGAGEATPALLPPDSSFLPFPPYPEPPGEEIVGYSSKAVMICRCCYEEQGYLPADRLRPVPEEEALRRSLFCELCAFPLDLSTTDRRRRIAAVFLLTHMREHSTARLLRGAKVARSRSWGRLDVGVASYSLRRIAICQEDAADEESRAECSDAFTEADLLVRVFTPASRERAVAHLYRFAPSIHAIGRIDHISAGAEMALRDRGVLLRSYPDGVLGGKQVYRYSATLPLGSRLERGESFQVGRNLANTVTIWAAVLPDGLKIRYHDQDAPLVCCWIVGSERGGPCAG